MEAKPGVIERLNNILTIELTAVNQYFVQAEMCRNWGYERLYAKLRSLSLGEMQDAQEMVRYILFLEGVPNVQRLNDVRIGETVLEDLEIDHQAELAIIEVLNEAIAHCAEVRDYATRNLLERMAAEEQEHVDWLETQLELIREVGIEHFLAQNIHA